MTKALLAAMVTLATLLVSVGTATPAQAYPEPAVSVTISDEIVVGGQKLVVHASASVSCDWGATFAGQDRAGEGKDFTASFKAPAVKKKTVFPLTVTCTYEDATAARKTAQAAGSSTVSRTFSVTVLPPDSQGAGGSSGSGGTQGVGLGAGPGGLLPGTGGPSAWLVLGGLALLLAGAASLAVARRRARGH